MPELVCEMIVTVDGWTGGDKSPPYYGYDGPEWQKWLMDNEKPPNRQLLGRKTYETMAELPKEYRDDGYDAMAAKPGFVFSKTLKHSDWPGLEIVSGDAVEFVRALKGKDGSELRTAGSVSLVQQFLAAGLVDRMKLMMMPLVLPENGSVPLWKQIPDIGFKLVSHTVLDGQSLILEYAPVGLPPYAK